MAVEQLYPDKNINTEWFNNDYSKLLSATGGQYCVAIDGDDDEQQQWGTNAPVASGNVSNMMVRVLHRQIDDGDPETKTKYVNIRVGGVWQTAQSILTSSSGWVTVEVNFPGAWVTADFADFAFEIDAGSLGRDDDYQVDQVEIFMTYEAVAITTLYRLGSGDWSDITKWSATSGGAAANIKPDSDIDVVFDVNSSGACVIDEDVEIASLDCTFTGTLDAATNNHNVTINGNCTLACTDLSWGTGDWTISGDLDFSGLTNYPTTVSSGVDRAVVSRLTMTGTGVTLTPKGVAVDTPIVLGALIVTGSITVQSYGALGYVLDNQGAITIDSGAVLICRCSSANAEGALFGAGSTVTGSGTFWISGTGLKQFGAGATIDCGTLNFANTTAIDIVSCTISSPNVAFTSGGSNAYQISGNVTFTGDVTFKALDDDYPASLVVQNTAYDPSLTFKGSLTFEESGGYQVDWTPGTGTLLFDGDGTQNVNTLGRTVDAIEINKTTGALTQSGDVSAVSFTATRGTINHNGHDVETTADYSVGVNAQYGGDQLGSVVTVGGNLVLLGESGELLTINNIDFDVTGSAMASYCDVTNSDASAGSQVVASESTDNGGNSNWLFSSFQAAWASNANSLIGGTTCI